jgi:hypothetical protein
MSFDPTAGDANSADPMRQVDGARDIHHMKAWAGEAAAWASAEPAIETRLRLQIRPT